MRVLLGVLYILPAVFSTGHAILRRRDPHSAAWWVVVVWALPIAGPVLYYFFGINRIERKASRLKKRRITSKSAAKIQLDDEKFAASLPEGFEHLLSLSHLVERVVKNPLTFGNKVDFFDHRDKAYPAMVQAINEAKNSVCLSTYIFNHDSSGRMFIDALSRAALRKVQVRVLIDDVGSGFFWSSVYKDLKKNGARVAYFMPTLLPWRMAYFNLRNHRKILTIDGKIAFTGSMNITSDPIQDIHFRLEGPVVARVQETFRLDWAFTTGEFIDGENWFPKLSESGDAEARAVSSGPDEDLDHCRWILLSAITNARKSIKIMTPYFLPDTTLINALNLAAMSGVRVDIIMPEKNDLMLVRWATQSMLWQVLERGCRVWSTPAPFDHSKLLIIDEAWVLFGSSNWDRRSLRLNFELDVECYDLPLARNLSALVDRKISQAREITKSKVDSRPMPVRLRDGAARLFSPLL